LSPHARHSHDTKFIDINLFQEHPAIKTILENRFGQSQQEYQLRAFETWRDKKEITNLPSIKAL